MCGGFNGILLIGGKLFIYISESVFSIDYKIYYDIMKKIIVRLRFNNRYFTLTYYASDWSIG